MTTMTTLLLSSLEAKKKIKPRLIDHKHPNASLKQKMSIVMHLLGALHFYFLHASSATSVQRFSYAAAPLLGGVLFGDRFRVGLRQQDSSDYSPVAQRLALFAQTLFYVAALGLPEVARQISPTVASTWMLLFLSSFAPLFSLCMALETKRSDWIYALSIMVAVFFSLPKPNYSAVTNVFSSFENVYAFSVLLASVLCGVLFLRLQQTYGQFRLEVAILSTMALAPFCDWASLRLPVVWLEVTLGFLLAVATSTLLAVYSRSVEKDTFLMTCASVAKFGFYVILSLPGAAHGSSTRQFLSSALCLFLCARVSRQKTRVPENK